MVLVQLLRIVLATVETWREVLCGADKDLDDDQDVGDQAQDGVRGDKVIARVRQLVVFDDDQASDGC